MAEKASNTRMADFLPALKRDMVVFGFNDTKLTKIKRNAEKYLR